jgi:hypothetical protein
MPDNLAYMQRLALCACNGGRRLLLPFAVEFGVAFECYDGGAPLDQGVQGGPINRRWAR